MRFYFPCARGEESLGRVEVTAGAMLQARLPKAFCARNVSMVWEALRSRKVLEGEAPYLGWEPEPADGQDPMVLMRGGASANLASLLAALHHEQPLDLRALGYPHSIWCSGELNPASDTAFLQPVGEIETKIRSFLAYCRQHGPALFIAPIGNVTEIPALRQEGGFQELRVGNAMPDIPPLRQPTILWVGCTREQCFEFVGRLLGTPEKAVVQRSRSTTALIALSALSLVLMSCLGFALVSSYRLRQEMERTQLTFAQEKRAKDRAERLLLQVRPLLQELLHSTQQQKQMSQERKQELRRLWHRVRSTEKRLRFAGSSRRSQRESSKIVQELASIQKQVSWLLRHHPARQQAAALAFQRFLPPPPPPAQVQPATKPVSPLCQHKEASSDRLLMRPTVAWQQHIRNTAFYPRFASLVTADFSPDSKLLLVATRRSVELREVHTGKKKFLLDGHQHALTGLAFSPHGDRAATASRDRIARLWSTKTGRLLREFRGHRGAVLATAFLTPYLLLTAGADRTVRRWDANSGRLLATHQINWEWASFAAFSPRATRLATTNLEKHVQLWDPRNGRHLKTLRGHSERVQFARFSRDGRFLATIGLDLTARVWDARTGQRLSQPLKHLTTAITSAAFSPDNRLLVTTTVGSVWFWDTCTGKLRMRMRAHQPQFFLFSPDSQFVASGDTQGLLRLWHAPMDYRNE